jgi:hypothetical protein
MDVETAGGAEGKSRFERSLAVLVGIAAVLAALLATLQVDSGKREERALLVASRLSVGIFEFIAAEGSVSNFQLGSARESLVPGFLSSGRAGATLEREGQVLEELLPVEATLAMAEAQSQERLLAISERMSEVPADQEGLDHHTREVMSVAKRLLEADLEELEEIRADPTRFVGEQNRQVDVAERYGRRGTRATFALSLLALAAVFLGLAGVTGQGRAGWVGLIVAAGALLLSAGWGASALLI